MISRRKGKILFFTLLVALFVSQGCGVFSSPESSITAVVATETITSATSAATKTPSPKPTMTSTATPDYVATQNFIETASIDSIISTIQPTLLADYPSPDGKWRVEVIRYDCTNYSYEDHVGIIAYEQLKLINLSDGARKVIADQRQNCGGLGAYGLDGLYWSPNNRYFYYDNSREG